MVMNHSYGQEKYCKWKIVYNTLPFMTWYCLQERMMLVKTPWKWIRVRVGKEGKNYQFEFSRAPRQIPNRYNVHVLCSMCVGFICWYCSKRGLGFRTCVQSLWHVSIKYIQFKKRKFNVGSWHLPWHACFNIGFLYLIWQVFETQLAKVKQRVMTYLGRLGGEVNHALLSGSDVCEEAIAWDAEQHLRFDVPFMDMKPQIYFGEYIWMLHACIVCEKFYKCWRIKNVEAFY